MKKIIWKKNYCVQLINEQKNNMIKEHVILYTIMKKIIWITVIVSMFSKQN